MKEHQYRNSPIAGPTYRPWGFTEQTRDIGEIRLETAVMEPQPFRESLLVSGQKETQMHNIWSHTCAYGTVSVAFSLY